FLLGWLLSLVGGLIWQACYNAIGNFFTFEVGTRKDHKLITTGPYAVVRHLGYTGGEIAIIGCLIVLNSCGWIHRNVWRAILGLSMITVMVTFYKVRVEDDLLCKEFGDEWEWWSERVPYRLVPWIY
ncbi:hypothetical protein BDQ17DRAFT_1249397, partial [Cyathus striatus]